MCVTNQSTFLLILRLPVGHQQDDLRAPPREAAEQQVPLQGDPSQHQGVSQADAETQGLRDLHKIGSAHGKSQVQRNSANAAGQLQEHGQFCQQVGDADHTPRAEHQDKVMDPICT